jgi:hypothetical protein
MQLTNRPATDSRENAETAWERGQSLLTVTKRRWSVETSRTPAPGVESEIKGIDILREALGIKDDAAHPDRP